MEKRIMVADDGLKFIIHKSWMK